jgi:hypothetical protein
MKTPMSIGLTVSSVLMFAALTIGAVALNTGTIRGVAYFENGNRASRVDVRVYKASVTINDAGKRSIRRGTMQAQTITNTNGQFTFAGLPYGFYVIVASTRDEAHYATMNVHVNASFKDIEVKLISASDDEDGKSK